MFAALLLPIGVNRIFIVPRKVQAQVSGLRESLLKQHAKLVF